MCELCAPRYVPELLRPLLTCLAAPQQILRIIEHAAAVAELLADVDGEKREEVLAGNPPPQP